MKHVDLSAGAQSIALQHLPLLRLRHLSEVLVHVVVCLGFQLRRVVSICHVPHPQRRRRLELLDHLILRRGLGVGHVEALVHGEEGEGVVLARRVEKDSAGVGKVNDRVEGRRVDVRDRDGDRFGGGVRGFCGRGR